MNRKSVVSTIGALLLLTGGSISQAAPVRTDGDHRYRDPGTVRVHEGDRQRHRDYDAGRDQGHRRRSEGRIFLRIPPPWAPLDIFYIRPPRHQYRDHDHRRFDRHRRHHDGHHRHYRHDGRHYSY